MINRSLLRVKIIQILYSYYKGDGKSLPIAEKDLQHSIEKTYDLYHHLLLLAVEITRFAADRIDSKRNKLRPTEEDLNPNTRFIENKFIAQLENNTQFSEYLRETKLSWVNDMEVVRILFERIQRSDFYNEYMIQPESNYMHDKELWRKIFKRILLQSEELDESLQDQNLFWIDDVEMVISFVIKTIKRFEEEQGDDQELLPMFKDEEDAEFALKLLRSTLTHSNDFRKMIDDNTRNWDLDRIAFMDILIMQVALAELVDFPTIPVNVTLNEYIEIAKKYSTERSGTFVNGVLDNIVGQLKSENKLIKVMMFSDNKK